MALAGNRCSPHEWDQRGKDLLDRQHFKQVKLSTAW
jgi:hypothetical protein